MAHVMILGQTLSGKSILAKRLAQTYKAQGISVLVHDPVGDPEWQADYQTANFDDFFKVYNESRQCAVFFDEVGETCAEYKAEMTRTATRGRHRGHRNHYIAQRGTLIHRTMRDQCTQLFLFNTGLEDCKVHSQEWNAAPIREDGQFLEIGEYYHKKRMGALSKLHLFT